jgi:ferric-dicitrate binding protein FerR (iron transport regulator)
VTLRRNLAPIFVCGALALTQLAAAQNPIVGKFTASRNAKISRGPAGGAGNDFVDAKIGQGVREGFAVRTTRRAFAEITFTDGSAIRVNEQTDLIVQSAATLRRIRLDQGEVWVKDENGSRTAVQTPVATATARGTEFTMDADGKVVVTDGEVDLTTGGTTLTLGPGDIGGIGPGGQPIKLGGTSTPGSDNWYQKAQQMPSNLNLGELAAAGGIGLGVGGGGQGPQHEQQAVPEPMTFAALAIGAAGLLSKRRRSA